MWKHTQPEFEHPVSNIHIKYLCSHYTVKASSYYVIWESHLEKSSLLTYVPLVEKLANKLSTVNYALIQVPMWCVPVWIHLHMSRHMYAYEHKCISLLFTSFSYWYRKRNNCHVTSQTVSPTFCGRPGYTCFFPLFNHSSEEALSLISPSKTPTHWLQNKPSLACTCARVVQALIKCLSHHYFV